VHNENTITFDLLITKEQSSAPNEPARQFGGPVFRSLANAEDRLHNTDQFFLCFSNKRISLKFHERVSKLFTQDGFDKLPHHHYA